MMDKQYPIALISTHGFLFKLGDNIIRFGKSFGDIRIHVYQDIVMNEKHIVDLHDPVNAQDAATKSYSFIPAIYIAPLQVLYYSEALPTTARILYRSFTPKRTGNCR